MLKNKNLMQKGFTIVELLIVIVVIAILAALVLNTFAGVQEKARDSDRQNDVSTIQSHLETYHANNGHYPTFAHLDDYTGWVDDNMEGLAAAAFYAPGVDEAGANSLQATEAGTVDQYGYAVTCSDATDETTCSEYTLSWWSEVDEAVRTIPSLSD